MFESYNQTWRRITLPAAADERIHAALLEAMERRSTAPARRKPRRLAGFFAAAVLCLVLAGTALAAGEMDFGEISRGLRLWLGIENGPVPNYIQFDTVTEAPDARWADVDHVGRGEIYLSTSGWTVRSENLVVAHVSVNKVLPEQWEDYVWLAQVPGVEGYIPAEVCASPYAQDVHFLQIAFQAWEDMPAEFKLTVVGGILSEDGSAFEIRRMGAITLDVPPVDEYVTVDMGDGISFHDDASGWGGEFLRLEIHENRLFACCRVPGAYDLWQREMTGATADVRHQAMMEHIRLDTVLNDHIDLRINGTDAFIHTGLSSDVREDDVIVMVWEDECHGADISGLESVTLGGVEYPAEKPAYP